MPPPAPGTTIEGRYRLVRPLASGKIAVVFEAEHLALGNRVAVKILRDEMLSVPGVAERFERDARAHCKLTHEHIVRVLDFGRIPGGALYLVMELLEGRSLDVLLAKEGALSPARAIAVADALLRGLAAADTHGLVHRALEADDVFVCIDHKGGERIKIWSFGTALEATAAPRDDVRAVGLLLYEMLSGARRDRSSKRPLPPLATVRSGLSSGLYAAVTRAIAPDPQLRFDSADAFRIALEHEAPLVFRMPAHLSVTDLGGDDLEPAGALPASYTALKLDRTLLPDDEPNLELDRPPSPPPAAIEIPPRYTRPSRSFAVLFGLLLLGGALYFARPKHEAIIELVHVPDGVRLKLDGTPILGRRISLTPSSARHELAVERAGQTEQHYFFSADRDRVVDLAEQP